MAPAQRRDHARGPLSADRPRRSLAVGAGLLAVLIVEGDGKTVSEFLLVPYFGACIHVPPPPSNQVVLVRTAAKPYKVNQMFDMVAVTGRLRTEASRNELASASYVIDATHVEVHKP